MLALEQLRREAAAAGALGFVVGWLGVSEDAITGQHQPILPPSVQQLHADHAPEGGTGTGHFELPAVWVGPTAREQLVRAAQASAEVTLRLVASVDPDATTDTLIATLPGTSAESIVLITHSDGVNAIQENGVVGMLALAQAFAKVPQEQRQRTLVFIPAAAHLATRVYDASTGQETQAEAEGAIAEHPELAADAVAVIAFEHFGTMEWVDDGERFFATGRGECAHVLTASPFLAETVTETPDRRAAPARPASRTADSGACRTRSAPWGSRRSVTAPRRCTSSRRPRTATSTRSRRSGSTPNCRPSPTPSPMSTAPRARCSTRERRRRHGLDLEHDGDWHERRHRLGAAVSRWSARTR